MQVLLSPQIMSLLEVLPIGAVCFDEVGEVHFANSPALMLLDLELADLMERRLQHALQSAELVEVIESVRGRIAPRATREIRAGGRPLSASVMAMAGDPSLEGLFILLLEDLTPFRRLAEMKSEFVSDLLHKLRTPLTTVRSVHQLVVETMPERLDPELLEYMRMSASEVDRLAALLSDLRDLFQIEADLMRPALEPRPLEPAPLLAAVMAEEEPRARAAGIKLAVLASGLPPAVRGDPELLRRVLRNVLRNALTYTSAGGRVTVTADGGHRCGLRLAVRDTGIGISEADLARVGEKFFRVDNEVNRTNLGYGLGLFVARHFVELHGGTLAIASRPDKGTEVEIRLPAA